MLFRRDPVETAGWRTSAATHLTKNDVGERHPAKEQRNLPAEFGPKIMGLTTLAQLPGKRQTGARGFVAARGADRFVDRGDDVGDENPVGVACQPIAAPWAPGGCHEAGTAQPGE